MNKKFSTLLVILAGVLWGTICVFVNKLTEYGLTSYDIGLVRMGLCTIILFIFILIYNKSLLKIDVKDIWMFLGTGVIGITLHNCCYFTTIVTSEASIAVSLLYTSPVWIMIFSAIIFKEKITTKKIISIVLTIIGCALIAGFFGGTKQLSIKAFIIGVLAGVFYGLYSIFGRYAIKKYNTLTITFYTFLFASIGFMFLSSPIRICSTFVENKFALLLGIMLAVICGILPYVFYTKGLDQLDTSIAGVLVAVEPVVGSVIGLTIYNEDKSTFKLLGIFLIIFSIVFVNINFNKRQKNKGNL